MDIFIDMMIVYRACTTVHVHHKNLSYIGHDESKVQRENDSLMHDDTV